MSDPAEQMIPEVGMFLAILRRRLSRTLRLLQILSRQRRDLVDKAALLQNQIREVLHKAMPGREGQYSHLWQSPVPLAVARVVGSS